MSGVSYCRSDFTAPWGLVLPLAEGCARFHLVVSGTAILREGEKTLRLETGDLVLVPHGLGQPSWMIPPAPLLGSRISNANTQTSATQFFVKVEAAR